MIVATTRGLADAVVAAVGLAVPCGDGVAPDGVGWQGTPGQSQFVGYAVVYPLAGNRFGGTLADPDKDVWWSCQVTSVGATRQQAEQVADVVRAQMQPDVINVEGVWRVYPDGGGGLRRDDGEQPSLFYVADIYRVGFSSPV